MEELFRKQPPVKPQNSGPGSNGGPNNCKEQSQVDGNSTGKKKDAVSFILLRIILDFHFLYIMNHIFIFIVVRYINFKYS